MGVGADIVLAFGLVSIGAPDTVLQVQTERTLLVRIEASDSRARTAVTSAFQTAFESETALTFVPTTESSVDTERERECAQRQELSCWARLGAAIDAPFVLVLSVTPLSESRWSASAIFIDVSAAGAFLERNAASSEGLEDLLFEEAAFAETQVVPPDQLSGVAEHMLLRARTRFKGAQVWMAPGRIRLTLPTTDQEVRLNGEVIGSAGGPTVLARVPPGRHTLAVRDPDGNLEYVAADVLVEPREEVSIELGYDLSTPAPAIRSALLITGLATLATGAGLIVYGATSSPDTSICPSGTCGVTGSLDTPSVAVPVGAGLLGAGAGWSAGVLLIGDKWQIPWLPFVVGVALGAGSFGIAYAVQGGAG